MIDVSNHRFRIASASRLGTTANVLGVLKEMGRGQSMAMKVHELVARCAKAGESANPMIAVREVLESLRGEIKTIERALDYVSGTGGNAGQVT